MLDISFNAMHRVSLRPVLGRAMWAKPLHAVVGIKGDELRRGGALQAVGPFIGSSDQNVAPGIKPKIGAKGFEKFAAVFLAFLFVFASFGSLDARGAGSEPGEEVLAQKEAGEAPSDGAIEKPGEDGDACIIVAQEWQEVKKAAEDSGHFQSLLSNIILKFLLTAVLFAVIKG